MGESGGFNGEIDVPGGSFSRLLLSPDDIIERSCQPSHPLFSNKTPKMLCFGDFTSEMSHISSPSSANASSLLHHSNKRRNGSGQECGLSPRNTQKKVRKKNKQEMKPNTITTTTTLRHAKGKREKLGERITALQQLVCPFGKTDTASVLHEAMGYIRFLQDQVKVLSSPYLQHFPSSSSSPQHTLSFDENSLTLSAKTYDPTKCLRSRGLCLVPVKCIIDIANINGADFWSSATSLSTPSTVLASGNSS
ncbi:hypothetical protein RND81_11G164700 [Saponaria officinalis]|uniref:BHLH domain-containing protein n=1 Tax=Saponaria officinalis TaxID=3572 RepID=A0AAW1HN03_SAPOF